MQKREKTLLMVLGVVGVVAVIIFLVSGSGLFSPPEPDLEAISITPSTVQVDVQTVMNTIESSGSVIQSDKFLMLTTFGKVPVTVNPDEMGKTKLF